MLVNAELGAGLRWLLWRCCTSVLCSGARRCYVLLSWEGGHMIPRVGSISHAETQCIGDDLHMYTFTDILHVEGHDEGASVSL